MKRINFLLLSCLFSLLLIACSVDDEAGTIDGAESPSEDGTEASDKIVIGALWPSAGIPPVQSKMEATEEMAEELGVDLVNMDAEFDAQIRSDQAKNLLAQQVDGVLVDLIDPQAIIPALKELHEAGIPVVTTTMPVAEEGKEYETAYVGGDNYNGGVASAQLMYEALGEKDGKVAIIEGAPGVLVQDRTEGFQDGVEALEDAKIEILDIQSSPWDRQKAMDIMQDYLTKFPDLDGVWVQHDSMVPGVLQAIEQAGKKDDIVIVGFGATIEGVDLIEDETIYGSVVEDLWWQAQEGVRVLVNIINEKDVPRETIGENIIIKKEDLDEYDSKNY